MSVGVLLLGIVGLLWAPFAAAICTGVSRIKKLPAGSYAGAGVKHSALFILPWLYQLLQMLGWPMPRFVVGIAYGLLYAVWALVFIVGQGFAVVSLVSDSNDAERQLPLAGMIVWIILYVVLLLLSAFTWGWSVRRLWKGAAAGGAHPELPLRALPDNSYLEPFYWLYGWTVVFFFMMMLVFIFYFSNSVL